MDTMNFVTSVQQQPVKDISLEKQNAVGADKNAAKNYGAGDEHQAKDFSDVLDDVVKQTEPADEPETPESPSDLPLLASILPAAVVALSRVSQPSAVEGANGEAPAPALPEGTFFVKPQPNVNSQPLSDKLAAFAGAMENALPQAEDAPQRSAPLVSVENKTSGQELLNMLSGKSAAVKMQVVSEQAGAQAGVAQPQAQPEKGRETVVAQTRLTGEEDAPLQAEKGVAGQEKQLDLGQRNFFSSDQEGGEEEAPNLRQKALPHEVKQEKAAAAEMLNENAGQGRKTGHEVNTAVLPESMNGPEQAKGNGFSLAAHAFEAREAPSQALSQAASVETPETMAKYKIADQIIEQARLIKTTEDTQMVIKLRPEHLGDLTLKVTVEHGAVSATFHSDNAGVRAMIETSLFQLKQELAAQGIRVDTVGVYAGLGEFMSNGQNQANAGQQGSKSKGRKIGLADFDEEAETAATERLNDNLSIDGVDYRI